MADVDLEGVTEEELLRELTRRRVGRMGADSAEAEEASLVAGEELSRAALQAWLSTAASNETSAAKPCPQCGKLVPVRGKKRERTIRAVSGEVRVARNYHYCSACRAGFHPLDRQLGLPEHGTLTAAMERRVLDFGVNDPFEEAAARWAVHYPTTISENLVRCVVERVGLALGAADRDRIQSLALPKRAAAAVLVVQADGGMVPTRDTDRWREVKVGAVVRQDCHLSSREAPRGQVVEARYAAHLGGVDEFRERLDALLRAESANDVPCVVWVGDGAPWIWNIADEICPHAIQVLDWYHAVEAASECAKSAMGPTDPCVRLFVARVKQLLWEGSIDALQAELQACRLMAPKETQKALTVLSGYYEKNRHRLGYRELLERGLVIGSGIIEAANKHVIQTRMKQAGQHWNTTRADRMADLRALYSTAGAARLHAVIRQAA